MGLPVPNESATAPVVATGRFGAIRKRILLADDQQLVRDAIALLLSLDEHTVVEAVDGAEAFDLFKPGHFDLVITDFEMPNMKGDELASRIKQAWPAQPVMMISAYAERLRYSDSAVDALLEKPFHLEDLRRVIAELLA
jgi:two-component system, chemotaxis family, chemotaxis protein CheY